MDPVHDRGSMDLVHESGPWTRSKVGVHGPLVHVLSPPLHYKLLGNFLATSRISSNFLHSEQFLQLSSYSEMLEQLLVLKLAFLPYFTMFPVEKKAKSSSWGRSCVQDKSSRARTAVFRENSKWWTKIHTRLTRSASGEEVIEQFYWLITFFGFDWGQSFLATLVTQQNCTKMFRNPTFVVQFARIRPQKFFRATFEQFFEKFRETFWKNSSKLYQKVEGARILFKGRGSNFVTHRVLTRSGMSTSRLCFTTTSYKWHFFRMSSERGGRDKPTK